MRWIRRAVLLCAALGAACAVPSASVRRLIEIQGDQIDGARERAEGLVAGTDRAIGQWQASVEALSQAFEQQQAVAAVQAGIASSNRELGSLRGVELGAAAYVIGELYLRGWGGLDQAVRDQFAADFEALEAIAKQIRVSWQELAEAHDTVEAYSRKTFLASADRELVTLALVEAEIGSERIEAVLARSKRVNENLERSLGSLLGGGMLQPAVQDLVDLLEGLE